jgi:hypothetical protein
MGWAFDDAPDPCTPEEHAARERANERFRAAGERAGARAQARARARGFILQEFITDSAIYRASGLAHGGLPIPEMLAWQQTLEQGKPFTAREVDDAAFTLTTLLETLALDALRETELPEAQRPKTGGSFLAILTLTEDMIRRRIKSQGVHTQFEFALALVEEVGWLGGRFRSSDGVSSWDTTDRYVSLASAVGV